MSYSNGYEEFGGFDSIIVYMSVGNIWLQPFYGLYVSGGGSEPVLALLSLLVFALQF